MIKIKSNVASRISNMNYRIIVRLKWLCFYQNKDIDCSDLFIGKTFIGGKCYHKNVKK